MRETQFVEQNKDKWRSFELQLRASKSDPEQLREQFIQVTDDLSYSRTFYRNRSVRVYLNGLAQKVYSQIYKNKRDTWQSIKKFFTDDVPYISYQARKIYLLSFILLLISVGIGMLSSARDSGFAASVLGEGYIQTTSENIAKGDPMGIYKHSGPFEMFVRIATNNLYVSLLFFISGLVFSYGSVVLMFFNGIMLGTFMYFFYSRGITTEFNYTVWMHGAIEISCMVFECAAGVILGRGLIFTGTLSRFKSFSVWAKRGAMLFLGLVPFIIFAAFIESFLTRYTEASNVFRGMVIFGSLALIVLYFVVYPLRKFRGTDTSDLGMSDLRPETPLTHDWKQVYNNGSIFLKSVQIMGKSLSRIFWLGLVMSLLLLVCFYFLQAEETLKAFELMQTDFIEVVANLLFRIQQLFHLYSNVVLFFNPAETLTQYVISVCWQTLAYMLACLVLLPLMKDQVQHLGYGMVLRRALVSGLAILGVYNMLLLSDAGFLSFLYILLAPVCVTWLSASVFFVSGPLKGFSYMLKLLGSGLIKLYGSYLIYLLVSFMMFVFVISPLFWLTIMFLEFTVQQMSDEAYTFLLQALMSGAFIFVLSVTYIFYFINNILLSFSVTEISTASSVFEKIEQIGNTRKAYGLETE